MNRAVFLDRDGTIIEDKGYPDSAQDMTLRSRDGEALAKLFTAGFLLVVVTNQSGIGRGYFSQDVVIAQHQRLALLANEHGVEFAGFVYCPHSPDAGCNCRKPSPRMLVDEAQRLDIDLAKSYMIGDKETDVRAGKSAGCKTIIIGHGGETAADVRVSDFPHAVEAVFQLESGHLP